MAKRREKKTPCKHIYCPNKRRPIGPNAPISDQKIAQRRSVVKISNLTNPNSAKFQKAKSVGFWGDHGVRGYKHNGIWKCF